MTLANDKVSIHTRYLAANAMIASRVKESGFANVLLADQFNFASGNRSERIVFIGETAPSTNYDSYAQVGDEYWLMTYSSGTPSTFNRYVWNGTTWSEALIVPQSTSVIRTAATKEIDVRSANSGTSDHRAIYARILLTHASAGSGDAVRGYAQTTGGAQAIRGGQFTAGISTDGSVTGLGVGVEGHIEVTSGLTLNAGTIACVDAETNNESSLLGVTSAAHIRIHDAGTYGMKSIIELGTIVGRSTDADALGPYTFEDGGITLGATDAKIAIRVVTPDGTFYLIGWAAGELSAT